VTLALNVAEPLIAGQYGRAAYDAVGPTLLILWADVGPGLLQAMNDTCEADRPAADASSAASGAAASTAVAPARSAVPGRRRAGGPQSVRRQGRDRDLLERARAEDARHWEQHRRPISAETLRRRLHVGAASSRALVAQLRDEARTGHGRPQPASVRRPVVEAGFV
jgi:hypothetical protein